MTNATIKRLALNLLKADAEEDVVGLLKDAGYWDNASAWRYFGDREGNYSIIGAQQSKPEAALTEKVVNSIDARLMNECMVRGIKTTAKDAPKSIREAVALFFEDKEQYDNVGGTLHRWDDKRRREIGGGITIALTGTSKIPCITVADIGEGQSPLKMPETFLSIEKQNKLRIHFVQGTYNMGGTGVLRFCGSHRFHLVITRRNPEVVRAMNEDDESSGLWGMTIIRRESPPEAVKNSVYTYLAPVDAEKLLRKGGVLAFEAEQLPLMPKRNEAYVRKVQWGTAVKMYAYDMKGFSGAAFRRNGLLWRLGVMLPEPALPVRMYECRAVRGHGGSYETTLAGLGVRLEDNKRDNMESGFPSSVPFQVNGENMVAKIYAFRKRKGELYRKDEGIIFTVNGQTHGCIRKAFFSRDKVKMGALRDSIVILINCSEITYTAREDLFMNSRDQLAQGEFRKAIERELEEIVRSHPGLRELRQRRKDEEIAERLDESRPLEEVLRSIFKTSPSLSSLFLTGNRLPKPTRNLGEKTGKGNGSGAGNGEFVGKEHPTYFRFKKRKENEVLFRDCEIGRRCRVDFETDVENSYFSRKVNPGRLILETYEDGQWKGDGINGSTTLHNGYAYVSMDIPEDKETGEELGIQFTVCDEIIQDAFVNIAMLRLKPKVKKNTKGGKRIQRGGGDGDAYGQSGIQMPKVFKVKEPEWGDHRFNRYSACKIVQDVDEHNDTAVSYRFYVNVDNLYLRTEMKYRTEDPRVLEAKFIYGNVLIGLGLIRDARDQKKTAEGSDRDVITDEAGDTEFDIEEHVRRTTRAIAPMILPMINELGGLSEEEADSMAQSSAD